MSFLPKLFPYILLVVSRFLMHQVLLELLALQSLSFCFLRSIYVAEVQHELICSDCQFLLS